MIVAARAAPLVRSSLGRRAASAVLPSLEFQSKALLASVSVPKRHFNARIRRRSPKPVRPADPSPDEAGQTEVHLALTTALGQGTLFAEESLTTAIGEGVDRVAAVKSLARLASPPRSLHAAEDALHTILRDASGDQEALLRLAAEEALWEVWCRSGHDSVDELLARGIAHMGKMELVEALQAFTEAIETAPTFAEGWNKRATVLFMMRKVDESIQDCLKVLELNPRHFGCLSGLGMCYANQGNHQAADIHLRRALEVHPGLSGPQLILDRNALEGKVNDRLRQRIVRATQALNDGTSAECGSCEDTSCSWDISRVKSQGGAWMKSQVGEHGLDEEPSWTYLVRVRVQNLQRAPSPLHSVARFFVLRFVSGLASASAGGTEQAPTTASADSQPSLPSSWILPLTRVTEGDAAFELGPGEEYRFAWQLEARHPLASAAGGLLLERRPDGKEESLLDVELQTLGEPRVVTADEVERLRLGYLYVGWLDLRQLSLSQGTSR